MPRLPSRPLHRAHDPVARRRPKRHKLALRALQREAVLVLPARWIRPQRRHANPVFDFHRAREPFLGRTVSLRRHPALDVPALSGNILRLLPQLDRLAYHVAMRVAIHPPPANPRQPRSAPHHAKVRLAKAIRAASARDPLANRRRRLMRLSCHLNHGGLQAARPVQTYLSDTNVCSLARISAGSGIKPPVRCVSESAASGGTGHVRQAFGAGNSPRSSSLPLSVRAPH